MGAPINARMGLNTWAAFTGTNEKAAIAGDVAMLESEVAPVLKALRKNGLDVVAIHHHMTKDRPMIIFLHYWGTGPAETLATAFKAAVNELGKHGAARLDDSIGVDCAFLTRGKSLRRMRPSTAAIVALLAASPVGAAAQETPPKLGAGSLPAVIIMDGRLTEPAWESADAVDDLRQSNPVEGAPPTARTRVRCSPIRTRSSSASCATSRTRRISSASACGETPS